jgi:hypothetical protein
MIPAAFMRVFSLIVRVHLLVVAFNSLDRNSAEMKIELKETHSVRPSTVIYCLTVGRWKVPWL